MHQGFHRELVTGNTRPLGPSGGSRLSATSGGSSNSDPTPPELKFPTNQTELITAEVYELLGKGAVSLVQGNAGGFISQIFIVPKKDRGYRPVINLRALNNYILEEHFKMEGSYGKGNDQTTRLVVKIDLKDAYLLVPIHPNHHKYLQFHWQSLKYQFNCLPFELSCAPRVFTKLMKPVVAFLREKGMRLIIYLDNILVMCECQEELTRQVNLIQDLFSVLGLTINSKKSQLSPVKELVFLGHQISTAQMRIVLPWEKTQKICGEATHLAEKSMVTIPELAAFLGMTNAAKQAIPIAPLFHRHIATGPDKQGGSSSRTERGETTIPKNGSPHTGSPGRTSVVGQDCQDIQFCPLIQPPPDLVIETDASLSGWGATCQELRTRGLWSVEEQKMHINALELLAVFWQSRPFPRGRIA